ncbi:hypothetical protein NONO_c36590 [Nocardia nova SH22a]|uniref:Saccharopine dehydrogenase n=1 Tax=Nocardia nova SH22a TaxID=1415166 RepID=W5TMJ6_9NOCA|nr:hypothetical protein [Nocardia nova]AHH18446.1 hypothetical protein NONO_c36590 [Nocardia nova SH22a]
MFVRQCTDRHHARAVETGARIVSSCGFDSIPSDIGVHQLYRRADDDGAGHLTYVTLAVRSIRGTGPDEKSRERGHFTIEIYAKTESGRRYRARFAMSGDPGYNATAVMLGEAALALATSPDRLFGAGGVLTPATAMGEALAKRLVAAGVDLRVD